jgi:hypothetical protein
MTREWAGVSFWRDVAGGGPFDPPRDEFLGGGTLNPDGSWTLDVCAGNETGQQRYFAQAVDNESLPGNVASATAVVSATTVEVGGACGARRNSQLGNTIKLWSNCLSNSG